MASNLSSGLSEVCMVFEGMERDILGLYWHGGEGYTVSFDQFGLSVIMVTCYARR